MPRLRGEGRLVEVGMGSFIGRLKDEQGEVWFEWSEVVDAPVFVASSQAGMEEYIEAKYGRDGMRSWPQRLARILETGVSIVGEKIEVEDAVRWNRAGHEESRLSIVDLIKHMREAL